MSKSLDGVLITESNMAFTCLHNKYSRWYCNIVNNARSRSNIEGYFENHHIIPKSLGGNNQPSNLVKLTAKEHFLCHKLLPKFTIGDDQRKMNYAMWAMATISNEHHERYKINSQQYSILKKKLAAIFSEQQTGRSRSSETRKKISETRKKLFAEGALEIKVYESTRKKLSENRKGKLHSVDTKNKIGESHRGKVLSEEHKRLLSEMYLGTTRDAEVKRKISETAKEQYASGRRQRVTGMKGKKLSAEAKQKISDTHKGKPKSASHRANMGKKLKGKTWKLINGKRVWLDKDEQ